MHFTFYFHPFTPRWSRVFFQRIATLSLPLFLILFSVISLLFGSFFTARSALAAATGEVLVFVRPNAGPAGRHFDKAVWPDVQNIAAALDLPVRRIDITAGGPEEVRITPLIMYQDHRGRAIYQGRTSTTDRIRNFLRTSRLIAQKNRPLVRKNTPVSQWGRALIWSPVKISSVTGTPPPGYDADTFLANARKAVLKGLTKYETPPEVSLSRTDRGFYMDFYPWRADDGTLFLTYALYSQFHCKTPVFDNKKAPVTGPWKDRFRMLEQAATVMQKAVFQSLADGPGGDAVDPVPKDHPIRSWADMGLTLPPAPAASAAAVADIRLPYEWQLPVQKSAGSDNAADDSGDPMILFRFPAPLDYYGGHVPPAGGHLKFVPPSGSVDSSATELYTDGMTGFIIADPSAIKTGEPDLDDTLQLEPFLDTETYPESRFTIEKVFGEGTPLTFGRLTTVRLEGRFFLKGKDVPFGVTVQMEPVLNDEGEPVLLLTGGFQLNLNDYAIEGADGPAPARHTLLVDLNLRFVPVSKKQ